MMNNEIVFDAGSGISEEEQREILETINGITEKNRQSLSAGAETAAGADADTGTASGAKSKKKRRFKAKKSGGVFPVLVNTAAIAALCGGFFALYTFQGKTDAQVREGAKVYNSAEREIINAIREETSSRLETKENEIALITSKLEGIDAELQELSSGRRDLASREGLTGQGLSAEEQETESRLKAAQEEYLATLAQLREERSRILDESRSREAALQTQLESRTRELAIVSEQSAAVAGLARTEMERISAEQRQTSAVEAHMAGLFANLNNTIENNRLDEASEIAAALRVFLNTPAFQALRSMQARKELYLQSINAFESMIETARRNQTALATGVMPAEDSVLSALQEKTARLEQAVEEKEQQIAEQEKTMAASGTELTRRVNDMERTSAQKDNRISTLERTNSTLEQTSRQKDNTITTLQTNLAQQTQAAQTSRQRADTLQSENTRLNETVTTQAGSLTQIQEILRGRNIDDMSFNEIRDSVISIQGALEALQ